jgi:hypothetical protein
MTRQTLARFHALQRRNALAAHPNAERLLAVGCGAVVMWVVCQTILLWERPYAM